MSKVPPIMPTLFDPDGVPELPGKPEGWENPVQLDGQLSRENRDKKMEQATAHADAVHPKWRDQAYEFLKKYIENEPGEFKCEDVRSWAAVEDFPIPPTEMAWGSVIVRAVKSGLIYRVRYDKVKNKKANCATVSVWKRTKY